MQDSDRSIGLDGQRQDHQRLGHEAAQFVLFPDTFEIVTDDFVDVGKVKCRTGGDNEGSRFLHVRQLVRTVENNLLAGRHGLYVAAMPRTGAVKRLSESVEREDRRLLGTRQVQSGLNDLVHHRFDFDARGDRSRQFNQSLLVSLPQRPSFLDRRPETGALRQHRLKDVATGCSGEGIAERAAFSQADFNRCEVCVFRTHLCQKLC